jgi:hypothetical protein
MQVDDDGGGGGGAEMVEGEAGVGAVLNPFLPGAAGATSGSWQEAEPEQPRRVAATMHGLMRFEQPT